MKQTEIKTLTATALQIAENTEIVTEKDYVKVAGYLQSLRELKDQAKAFVDPILAAVRVSHKEAKAVEKAVLGPILEADTILRKKANEVEFERPEVDGITVRRNLTFEIVDVDALHRGLMSPDPVKIRKLVKAVGLGGVVDGVRIYETETIAVSKPK